MPIVPHTPWKEKDDCTVLINKYFFFLKKKCHFLVYKCWNYLENPTMDKFVLVCILKNSLQLFQWLLSRNQMKVAVKKYLWVKQVSGANKNFHDVVQLAQICSAYLNVVC